MITDPEFAQRDRLLDTAQMADRLARLLGGAQRVADCHVVRVNYQVGRSLRVVYQLQTPEAPRIIAARVYPARQPGKAAKVFRKASAVGRPTAFDPQLEAVFWDFPNDRRIDHLPAVWNWRSTRLVAYAPEKSAMLQCLAPGCHVLGYAKVCGRYDFAREVAVLNALRSGMPDDDPDLCLPPILDVLPALRTLLFQAVPGEQVGDRQAEHVERLGAALGRFHTLPPPVEAPLFARFDVCRLLGAAGAIKRVRPDVGAAALALARQLVATRPSASQPPVALHGDVHLKNAILTGERIALIDFEDVARGPAAADVGSLLAELRYRRRLGLLAQADERAAATAFLSGYASVRPLPASDALRWHTAAALLVERGLGAVNRVRLDGLRQLDALLADAMRLAR